MVRTKTKSSLVVLAGDIGGTNSRLGLFRADHHPCRLIFEKTFLSKNYSGLQAILREFLRGQKIASACFGVAGPVTRGIVKATNLPWLIDIRSVQKELSLRKVEIINDLVANAYGICMLKKSHFQVLNTGKKEEGMLQLYQPARASGKQFSFGTGTSMCQAPLRVDMSNLVQETS